MGERTHDVLTVTHSRFKGVHQIPTGPPRDNAMCMARPAARGLGGPAVPFRGHLLAPRTPALPWVAMTSPQRKQGNQANIWGAESLF